MRKVAGPDKAKQNRKKSDTVKQEKMEEKEAKQNKAE